VLQSVVLYCSQSVGRRACGVVSSMLQCVAVCCSVFACVFACACACACVCACACAHACTGTRARIICMYTRARTFACTRGSVSSASSPAPCISSVRVVAYMHTDELICQLIGTLCLTVVVALFTMFSSLSVRSVHPHCIDYHAQDTHAAYVIWMLLLLLHTKKV